MYGTEKQKIPKIAKDGSQGAFFVTNGTKASAPNGAIKIERGLKEDKRVA